MPKKKLYQQKGIIAIVILALITVLVSYIYVRANKPKIAISNSTGSKACQFFMSEVAQAFAQPDLCKKVSLDIIGTAGFNPPGLQISYERSDCFNAVAEETGNESLCAEVKPISTQYLDGSKINQSYCVNKIEEVKKNNWKNGGSVPFYEDDKELNPIMDKLGYTENDLILAQAAHGSGLQNSAVYQLYKSARTSPDFFNKINNLPSYNESTSSATRTPNSIEFLYDTVAVDLNKPELCGNISPNAFFYQKQELPNYPNEISLRNTCYWGVATDYSNPSLCDSITPGDSIYGPYPVQVDGQQTMQMFNEVQTCKYAEADDASRGLINNTGTPVNSIFYGTGEDFIKAFSQLGYKATSTTANSETSYTWSDYINNLSLLVLSDKTNSEVTEFLNRVNKFDCNK